MQEQRSEAVEIVLPRWEMLPDIGLYMDQVITLMERTFSPTLPKGEITKSMVNNYVKVGLIPRPTGKKYDREHLAILMMIGVLKQALNMESIAQLLVILCEESVRAGYARFCELVQAQEERMLQGHIDLSACEESPQEQALRAGIAAAVCTICARRLLDALQKK
ncbi:MAG: DUF1836 domain-containing protein [Clostridia bacterium]|nr:DUF1836 domain-containing protein [Clostridia bacterium]